MENKDTGLLLNKEDIQLHRNWFKEMVSLLGIQVIYRSPRDSSKHYDGYGELFSFYNDPEVVGCIFDEHPTQKTMRKLGWDTEQMENLSVIHVPYDLPGLQVGALFIIPSGLDNAEGRVFKVITMSNIAVYPASVACEIGPVIENKFEPSQFDYSHNTFNLLNEEED